MDLASKGSQGKEANFPGYEAFLGAGPDLGDLCLESGWKSPVLHFLWNNMALGVGHPL